MYRQDGALTYGPWKTEADTVAALLRFLNTSQCFHVSTEVEGNLLWTHGFQISHGMRADLLLIPNRSLRQSGWSGGSFVVEAKRPNEKIGPAFSQLLDYMNTSWHLTQLGGILLMPSYGFLFQATKQNGPNASLLAHQHIGTCEIHPHNGLRFFCGECHVLTISIDGSVDIGNLNFGRKAGRR